MSTTQSRTRRPRRNKRAKTMTARELVMSRLQRLADIAAERGPDAVKDTAMLRAFIKAVS